MESQKPTIFMTISVGMIARNLLHNEFFRLLKDAYNVVIFTPLNSDPDFIQEFGGTGVTLEFLNKAHLTKGERLLNALHKSLIYNPSVMIKAYYGTTTKHWRQRNVKKVITNFLERIIFGLLLSRLRILRDFVKWLDARLYRNYREYEKYFATYNPVLCFITNIGADNEIYFLRCARKHGVKTLAMTKSWDNFSKIGFRDKADHLIVWSDFMKDEAIAFQNYKREDISVVGIPQFDIYATIGKTTKREDFITTYRLDPSKKIILFGHAGTTLAPDDPYVVELLRDWILEEHLPYQILVRPHFGHPGAVELFSPLEDGSVVFVDAQYERSHFKRGGWDISRAHHERLALSLTWSDVIVSSITTLVLDGIACGNKVICYAFDRDKRMPYPHSIKRLYETLWFKGLVEEGLKGSIAESEEALYSMIRGALSSPSQGFVEYRELKERFCYRLDGKAGFRLFNVVERFTKKP